MDNWAHRQSGETQQGRDLRGLPRNVEESKSPLRGNPRLVKSKYCDHGLLPQYCAHCKYGVIINC